MPFRYLKPISIERARHLRKNPTPFEYILWTWLRKKQLYGVRFRRQHPIGPFIVDFCAPRNKLIIEVDGNHHLEQTEYDASRTLYLQSCGYRVLRFYNKDIANDIQGVLAMIISALQPPPASPISFGNGGGRRGYNPPSWISPSTPIFPST
jgi:very-short-patch-repair endonuclease